MKKIFSQWIVAVFLMGLSLAVSAEINEMAKVSVANPVVEYSGIAISDVNIHGEGAIAHVKPGETIGVYAHYKWLWAREQGSIVQIIVGIDGEGAQVSIANGVVIGRRYFDYYSNCFSNQLIDITEKDVSFAIVAPEKPGAYEVRFRYAQAYLPHEAVSNWWSVDHVPTAQSTIGKIVVE